MIITVIILALSCIFAAGYALTGLRHTKRFAQMNSNLTNLIISLNDSAGQTPDTNADIAAQIVEAYNARADIDEKLADYRDNMMKLICVITVIALLAVFAGFVL